MDVSEPAIIKPPININSASRVPMNSDVANSLAKVKAMPLG